MTGQVTFKGSPMNLLGKITKEGAKARDFTVVSQDLKEVSLAEFKDKIKVITTFPSLDTPVCDLQVKEFNQKAAGFSADKVVVGISMDLPFAQKRFCQMNDIKNVKVLSDYKYSSFGINYGLLVKELRLLARAVIIVDKLDIIRYIQIVGEMTQPPDYQEALDRLKEITG